MSDRTIKTTLICASGMLGRAFVAVFKQSQIIPTLIDRTELDLTDPRSVESYSFTPRSAVVNCAGYTDVDGAEREPELANTINGESVGALARACQRSDATLVHFSTDYVFNGEATTPYPVDAPIDPINAYGRSKALGEQLIRESGCRHLIVRTSWLYAPWGKNFVRTMAGLMRERDSIKVVDDQRGRPTSAEHLAATTIALLRRGAEGTWHLTDGGECTWYEFALEIARLVGYKGKIEPCTTADFPRPAKRPTYSVLDLSATEKLLARPMPDWRANLAREIKGTGPFIS